MAKSRTSGKISGEEYVSLRIKVDQLSQANFSELEILKAIIPKSLYFKTKWLEAMKQILLENNVIT